MGDFYHFCPLGTLLDAKIYGLQTKWIGGVLAKTCGMILKHWQVNQKGLGIFLPKDMSCQEAIVQHTLCPVVELIRDLVHHDDEELAPDLTHKLDTVDTVLVQYQLRPFASRCSGHRYDWVQETQGNLS